MSSVNKSDLIRTISVKAGISQTQAETAINAFFDGISEGMSAGKRIELRGFGSFSVREYDGYVGRNPRTGEDVNVGPKRSPFFKAGKEVKNVINR